MTAIGSYADQPLLASGAAKRSVRSKNASEAVPGPLVGVKADVHQNRNVGHFGGGSEMVKRTGRPFGARHQASLPQLYQVQLVQLG